MGPPYRGNLFKNKHTPYGLRGEDSTLELPNFNLKFLKKIICPIYELSYGTACPLKYVFQGMEMTSKVNCKIVAFLKVSYSFLVTFLAIL